MASLDLWEQDLALRICKPIVEVLEVFHSKKTVLGFLVVQLFTVWWSASLNFDTETVIVVFKLTFAHAVHTGIIKGQRMMSNIPSYLVALAHSRVHKESTVTAVLTIHHTVLQL
jgi:hypothetical protein